MKKLFKNKQGFTLIELLVVIGILAVLAAIAIPSVAGLIDRANKSADNTNANEMTNAVERFVSEYELYKQDIASGTFKESDLDSAQGRVFNVTGIKNRGQVTAFESEDMLNGKGVNLDSKYPVNEETFKAVVQNYMKTSSSTFEPKQSDCQYWYSPECGRVIVAEVGSKASELTAIGFDDASINTVLDTTDQYDEIHWICLDAETTNYIADENGGLVEYKVGKQPVEILTFSINGTNYQYEDGMSWNDWINSEYNTAGFYFDTYSICNGANSFINYPAPTSSIRITSLEEITDDNFEDFDDSSSVYYKSKIVPITYYFEHHTVGYDYLEPEYVKEDIERVGYYILLDGNSVEIIHLPS